MDIFIALILSAFFTVVYIYLRKNKTIFVKPKAVKKDELIQNYRVELLEILEKYEEAEIYFKMAIENGDLQAKENLYKYSRR